MTAYPFKRRSIETHSMRDKIFIIEALIFLLPFLILLYIVYQGDYHFNTPHVILFGGIAVFILTGMIILRQILDRVSSIAMSLTKAESDKAVPIDIQKDVVELHEISISFNNLLQKLEQIKEELAKKTFQLSTIRDLTEIVKSNLSIDDQMNLLLEKSMAVTGARIGSVFMVEPETRQKSLVVLKSTSKSLSELYRFRVVAAKGHDEELKQGSLINIDSSVVKAVLLERGPLLITDIEKDPRSLKTNDPKYGPPSFLSMPIFIGPDVSAILNLANKETCKPFDSNDEQVLFMMLKDIGFALEIVTLQSRIMGQLAKITGHNLELEKEIEGRKRTERALTESEKKFRLLVENSNDIIYSINLMGHFVYVNPVAERITGFPESDLIGRQYLTLVRPDYHQEIEVLYKKQLNENIPSTYFEFPIIAHDGSTKWIGQNVQLLSKDDKYIGFQAVARDITENIRSVEALTKSEYRYKTLLSNMSDVVFSLDSVGNIAAINNATSLYGYEEEDLIGKSFLSVIHPEDQEKVLTDFHAAISNHRDVTRGLEFRVLGKDGSIYWAELTSRKLWDKSGHYLQDDGVLHDITDRKKHENI
jgi:PAS domain S-box-containing protein